MKARRLGQQTSRSASKFLRPLKSFRRQRRSILYGLTSSIGTPLIASRGLGSGRAVLRFEEAVMSKGQPGDEVRNRLLAAIEAASLARIAPHLEPVVLKL